jgi:hypothetical protein
MKSNSFTALRGDSSKRPRMALSSLIILIVILSLNLQPTFAIGKTRWWTDNVTGGWWDNGITCWEKDKDIYEGAKVRFSYKLGQSKKWIVLETVSGIPGDTLVDDEGNPDESEDATTVCDDGADDIGFVLSKLPGGGGGAYLIKYDLLDKSGKKVIWSETDKVLGAYSGIQSTSSFFTNPPNVSLPNYVYENLSPSLGIKAFTNSGKPRHACLIFYDLVLSSVSHKTESIYAQDIISSAQGGWLGANIRETMGTSGGTIQGAIKCANWIAEYLW